jgi:sec-independent protein translocase protein TatB
VFSGLGWEELLLLVILGLIIFGPDRLPKAAKDLGQMLRQVRAMARGAANDLRTELGPEMADIDLRTLHPRRFVEDALFGDDEPDDHDRHSVAAPAAVVPLGANERPPYDVDAT